MKKMFYFLCFLWLSACSSHYASNAENEYIHSHHGLVVQVPPPLVKQDFSQYYLLPAPHGDPRVSIVPPIDPIQEHPIRAAQTAIH